VIVAQPGLDTPAKLKGKTLDTFQMDTLEVLPYDWLKKNGVAFNEITARYMGNTPEAVEAFKVGALDFICTIEPYALSLQNDVKGSVMLSNGVDIYGPRYTDCVLAARSSLIEQQPEDISSANSSVPTTRPRSKMPGSGRKSSRLESTSAPRPTSSSAASSRSSKWATSSLSPGMKRSTGRSPGDRCRFRPRPGHHGGAQHLQPGPGVLYDRRDRAVGGLPSIC